VKFDETGQNNDADPVLLQWTGGSFVTIFPGQAAIAEAKKGLAAEGIPIGSVLVTDDAIDGSGRDARIIIEEASAIRAYTLSEIYPLLDSQLNVQFLPHTVSAYAAQTNFKLVQKKLPEYSYREPALNPTNVNDRAVDWEAEDAASARVAPPLAPAPEPARHAAVPAKSRV
jgi:hypothetical protein